MNCLRNMLLLSFVLLLSCAGNVVFGMDDDKKPSKRRQLDDINLKNLADIKSLLDSDKPVDPFLVKIIRHMHGYDENDNAPKTKKTTNKKRINVPDCIKELLLLALIGGYPTQRAVARVKPVVTSMKYVIMTRGMNEERYLEILDNLSSQ